MRADNRHRINPPPLDPLSLALFPPARKVDAHTYAHAVSRTRRSVAHLSLARSPALSHVQNRT